MGSFTNALEDGIEFTPNMRGYWYKIPCEICGRKIRSSQYSRKRTYLCDYCKGVIKERKKVEIPSTETKHDRRFNSAVENIRKTVKDFQKYEKAIEVAKGRAYQYGSIPEAMVAIELLKNKFKIIPQQKIGRYKVDFAIPEIKVVFEVDGKLYHSNLQSERERDFVIHQTLGFQWMVIHYPAEYVLKDITKVAPFIREYIKGNK
ncbi:endonuclease domain-containing protein [[Clostridium] symbiosum]|uniref:endonuclease domain-containing protein n=1 Tax=Clostridium symbiosum TaxID=1512 RepID=UPI00321A9316